MFRRTILKVVKTNYTPSAPWMVRVPPRLQRIEGARKKFFAKESIAKPYVERLAKQLKAREYLYYSLERVFAS
jgi:hypothetical protein